MKEMMKTSLIAAALLASFAATASAHSPIAPHNPPVVTSNTSFTGDVLANDNSTQLDDGSMGTGLDTGILVGPGTEVLTFTVDPTLTWNTSGGDPTYQVNADGYQGNGGTTENGLTAKYGALVGQIGNGSFFLIGSGTNTFSTSQTGELTLFAFDSDNQNNSGFITASVSAVPEPASIALMIAGLGFLGFAARRKSV